MQSFLASASRIAWLTCVVQSARRSWSTPEPLSVLVEPTIRNEISTEFASPKWSDHAVCFCPAVALLPSEPPASDELSGEEG
jgi:hypothetical protein